MTDIIDPDRASSPPEAGEAPAGSGDSRKPSGRFLLRADPELHAALKRRARRAGLSLNQYCIRVLAQPAEGTDEELVAASERALSLLGDARDAASMTVELARSRTADDDGAEEGVAEEEASKSAATLSTDQPAATPSTDEPAAAPAEDQTAAPSAKGLTLHLERTVAASPEAVFSAWTDPDRIREWFCPDPDATVVAELDLRAGGGYAITMDGAGGRFVVSGAYREVAPPGRLAFTWDWAEAPPAMGVETVVTVELAPHDEGTEVRVKHAGFPRESDREGHQVGWTMSLDRLAGWLGDD